MADVEAGTGGVEVGGLPPEPQLRGPLKPVQETTPAERIMAGVACVAVGTSLAAMIVEGSTIVVIAGILSSLMGPYAYYQQTHLTDIKTLQETQEAVEHEVDRLKESNERLSKNITELGGTVDRLEEVENALDVLSQQQGKNVQAFADQVEQNKQILKEMQGNVKSTIVNNLMSVVYASDTDHDFVVDEGEIEKLIGRLQRIGGITVDEAKFRAAFSGGSVGDLMNVVTNLLKDDIPDDQRIFKFKDESHQ